MRINEKLLLGLCFVTFSILSDAAESFDLDLIMQQMTKSGGHTVRFVERRELDILDRPLESKGELTFIPPSSLEKRVIEPKSEIYFVDRDLLTIVTGDRHKVLQLANFPGLRAFVEAFRASLAGDSDTLQRFYKIDLKGSLIDWKLTLTPLQADMAKYVSFVIISGAYGQVSEIETIERNGDVTLMKLDRQDD